VTTNADAARNATVNADRAVQPTPLPLTEQHIRILTHLAQGDDRRLTARALGITPVTIDGHLKRIRHRMGAVSTLHAVCLAVATGVVSADAIKATAVTP
jgi:DNA-binding CsgD family transcriptional regulator